MNEIKTISKVQKKDFIRVLIWMFKEGINTSKPLFVIMLVSQAVIETFPILITYFGAKILNELVRLNNTQDSLFTDELIKYVALSGIVLFINSIAQYLRSYSDIKFNYLWDYKKWIKALDKMAALDFQYVESPEYKIFLQKVREALYWRAGNTYKGTVAIISSFIGLLVISGILISINPLLLILITIPVALNFIIDNKFGKELYGIWDGHGEEKLVAWYAQEAFEKSDVLRESKIYGFSKYIIKKYEDMNLAFFKSALAKLNKKYLLNGSVSLFEVLIFVGIQILLISRVLSRTLDLGGYTFYLANIQTISTKLNDMERIVAGIFEQIQYTANLKQLFELPPLVKQSANAVKLPVEPPEIEFRNVYFKYPQSTNYILEDVSFKVGKKEKLALVGKNGAGKTTLIKLLARFYDVEKGEILINGINIKEIDIESYYKLWGVLFQNFATFWFSAKENIGIGNLANMYDLDAIKEAATKTGANEFIEKLDYGYDNMLSPDFKGGVEPSGGQWQKLGLARGLFANPSLIVLDEPTSALDALAEAQVFDQIRELGTNTTMIIVSHRFATVRNASKIVVLDQGKIIEIGTHEELLSAQGLYSDMFKKQAEGYQ